VAGEQSPALLRHQPHRAADSDCGPNTANHSAEFLRAVCLHHLRRRFLRRLGRRAVGLLDGVDLPTASDYQNIYITNDASHIFIRVTLHAPSDLGIFYNNLFVDGDNNSGTGYSFRVGSEMLVQGGGGYQEKNGGFNEGEINGLDWAIQPDGVGTDFEFRISRNATYASDGLPVFTASAIGLLFDAENTSFQTVDTAPDSGGLLYALFDAPSATLGRLRFETDPFGQLILHWSGPGVLQARSSLTSGQWETIWDQPAPYLVGEPIGQQFFRLFLPCP
jgi:hypothetical protein